MSELHFFDPRESFSVLERRLPHCSQAGVVCFVTFRTNDSLPRDVLRRFHADRRHWLRANQIDPDTGDWREQVSRLASKTRVHFYRTFSRRWHRELDRCLGCCPFRDPALRRIVHDSLLHFDGQHYEMSDLVIMPNHVHLLVAFADDDAMLKQCESWKRFTARAIHRRTGGTGRFWQQDGFDHLVRSVEQYEHFRRYIAENPKKAGLEQTDCDHYQR